jgi:hypothetical protein
MTFNSWLQRGPLWVVQEVVGCGIALGRTPFGSCQRYVAHGNRESQHCRARGNSCVSAHIWQGWPGHRYEILRFVERAGAILLKQFKLRLPVQPPLQKYFRSLLTQITCISPAIPSHTEGRFAIVTDVGTGCDGRGVRT